MTSSSVHSSSRPAGEIHLSDIFATLMANRSWLLASMAIALAMGYIYIFLATPQYRADALIQVEQKNKSLTNSQDELYEIMSGRDTTAAELELVKSRLVIGKIVDDLHLDIKAVPHYFPLFGRPVARSRKHDPLNKPDQVLFEGSRYAWGSENIHVTTLDLPPSLYDKRLLIRTGTSGAYELVSRSGDIIGNADGQVGAMLEFQTAAGTGRLFVQELNAPAGVEFFLTLRHRLAVIEELAKRLVVSERTHGSGVLAISYESDDPAKTTRILNSIATAYQVQNVERRSAEAAQTLAFLDQQLPRIKQDLETSENALSHYRLTQKSADLSKETELTLQTSVDLEKRRVDLDQKRTEALHRFASGHPAVQALDEQIKGVETEMKALQSRVKDLPETQQELLRLSRDVQVNSNLYTTLLNNAEQLQVTKAGTISNVRIVDYAIEPFKPVKPDAGNVLYFSLVCGLLLGLISIFLRKALQEKVGDSEALERLIGLPTLAIIPYSIAQRNISRKIDTGKSLEGILAVSAPFDRAIEAVRSLRTALQVNQESARNNVLLISGPTAGLGKSFVAANLATTLALTGRKVLMVDADLRRGRLHQFVAQSRQQGLSDLIAGRCTEAEAIHVTSVNNLWLMPTGDIPDNPSELLSDSRLDAAVASLSAQFDFVVIDSAPILAVSDALLVGRLAGTTLLVVKAGHHSTRELLDAVKRFTNGGTKITGTVLNQIGASSFYNYSYTGYYDYNYKSLEK